MTFARRRLLACLLIPLAFCAACGSARVVRVEQPAGSVRPAPARTGASAMPAARPPVPKPMPQPLPDSREHVVQAGETLYGISFGYGLRYQDVAGWNGIGEPYAIRAGQRLRLQAPVTTAAVAAASASPEVPTPFATVAAPASSPPPASASGPAPAAASAGVPRAVTGSGVAVVPAPTVTPSPAAVPAAAVPAAVARMPVPETPAAAAVAGATPSSPAVAPVGRGGDPSVPIPAPAAASAGNGGLVWRWPTQGQLIGRFVGGDQTQQGINIAGNSGQPVAAAAEGVVVYSGAGLVGYGELIILKHSNEWLSAYAHNRRRLVAEGAKVRAGEVIAEMGRTGAIRDMLHFEIRRNGKPVDPLALLPAKAPE